MIMVSLAAVPILAVLVASSEKRRRTFRQRLGWWRYAWEHSAPTRRFPTIWIHALSVGEVTAVQPLVQRLRGLKSECRIVFTTSTLTGFQTARRLLERDRVDLAYFPYDLMWSVRKIIRKINPTFIILVETDLWPNFLLETTRRQIPVSIVNLRLSPTSWKRLRQFKPLAALAFGVIEKICTQTRRDARRLERLGVADHRIVVTGNLKFDSPLPIISPHASDQWRRRFSIDSRCRVVVAGSTHDNEESMVLKALEKKLKNTMPTLLILVPRDPGRAGQVMKLCRNMNLRSICLSGLDSDGGDGPYPVVVVDGIGHLKSLYGLADIAFVGGSLVPEGGHNPLEPAAYGKPVLFGRHMEDFQEIAQLLLETGGAKQVQDTGALGHALTVLLDEPNQRHRMGQRALSVLRNHRGAVDRSLSYLGLLER
jgi:3-deoxy-D-manno-octulosonic-acid transferase